MTNRHRLSLVVILALFAVSAAPGAQGRGRGRGTAGLTTEAWTVDGVRRTALVAAPARRAGAAPAPLVFVFHGHGGNSANAARSFGIHTAWPEAIVIYPQGLPTVGQLTDPEGTRPGWQHEPGGEGDRDLKFVDAMLAWATGTHAIDPARVFAAGHSNGGSMVYLLWAARGDRFAALAPSSSVFRRPLVPVAKPKPVFIVAGRKDPLVLFTSQQRSLESVLRLNQAEATGRPWSDSIVRHASSVGADVFTYIHPGGHQLPDDAGEKMVTFFKSAGK